MSLANFTSFPNGICTGALNVNGYIINPRPNGLFDGAALDAFARQRVSSPVTLFDAKQIHDKLPLLFDDQEVSGGGTGSVHSAARASTVLSVSADTAGKRVRQTFQRFNYQPGKSLLVILTGVIGDTETGITKRWGYFDDDNGIFFQCADGVMSVGVRSKVSGTAVDTIIPQSEWNVDTLDGEGASEINLDPDAANIFVFDIEWLGAGRVRFGVFVDGLPYYCHYANHANELDSVYMSTPNLPIRYEIANDGNGPAAESETICSTVQSEGGFDPVGFVHTVGRSTGLTMANNADWQPLLSLRLNPTRLGATVDVLDIPVLTSTASVDFEIGVFLNPTIAGTDAVDWVTVTNSSIQYDVTRTNANTVSAGTRIGGSIGASGGVQSARDFMVRVPTVRKMGANIAGTPDEFVIAVRKFSGTTPVFYALANLRELQ